MEFKIKHGFADVRPGYVSIVNFYDLTKTILFSTIPDYYEDRFVKDSLKENLAGVWRIKKLKN